MLILLWLLLIQKPLVCVNCLCTVRPLYWPAFILKKSERKFHCCSSQPRSSPNPHQVVLMADLSRAVGVSCSRRACGRSVSAGSRRCAASGIGPRLAPTGPLGMARAALLLPLLLGLLAPCRAEFAPPTLNINLDEDPEVRWAPLTKVFDVDFLKKAAAEVIE